MKKANPSGANTNIEDLQFEGLYCCGCCQWNNCNHSNCNTEEYVVCYVTKESIIIYHLKNYIN